MVELSYVCAQGLLDFCSLHLNRLPCVSLLGALNSSSLQAGFLHVLGDKRVLLKEDGMGQDMIFAIFQRSQTFLFFGVFFVILLIQYQDPAITTSLCFTVNRQKPKTGKPDQITELSPATARCILLVVLV